TGHGLGAWKPHNVHHEADDECGPGAPHPMRTWAAHAIRRLLKKQRRVCSPKEGTLLSRTRRRPARLRRRDRCPAGFDCGLEVRVDSGLVKPNAKQVVTDELFDLSVTEVPEVRRRHVDPVPGRRDLTGRSRKPSEMRALDSQLDGDDITERMHREQ